MRLARLLHSTVSLIAAGNVFDPNVLKSIEAASATILGGNRDATDAELLGLENLIDQLIAEPSGEAEAPGGEEPASGGSDQSGVSPSDASALSPEPSGDPQDSVVVAPEAGEDLSSQESESVTAVAPPEASPEAPAELSEASDVGPPANEQLTEVAGDPLPPPADEGVAAKEELFAPQPHDEDDGA